MAMNEYRAAAVHRAARFAAGMAATDAEALVGEINKGRNATKDAVCVFNGSAMYIIHPTKPTLTAEPGDWIVAHPDGSLDVHADPNFQNRFCPTSS